MGQLFVWCAVVASRCEISDYLTMKPILAILSTSLLLCSCADMYVTKTDVAGGASSGGVDGKDYGSAKGATCGVGAYGPKAIYIRPFCIGSATFSGYQTDSDGEMALRKALVPVSFAGSLKESLERIAPARILRDNESPRVGWLVDGEFQMVEGGRPGRSFLSMHVRITDVARGAVVYEFDVAGGQFGEGSIRGSGFGKATPFDLENAAERIYLALTANVERYGTRSSLVLR